MTHAVFSLGLTLAAAAPSQWTILEVPVCPGAEFVAGSTADLKHFACAVKQGRLLRIEANGRPGPPFEGAEGEPYDKIGTLHFSPDGGRFVYGARKADKWSIVESGVAGTGYEELYAPVFSEDGARMAHGARRDAKDYMVVDGRRVDVAYDSLGPPSFSPAGGQLAYAAKRGGNWWIVVDGVELGPYKLELDRRIVFDGPARFYALARADRQIVRLQGDLPR